MGFTLVVAYKQWEAMDKSNTLSRETLVATQRAYVTVSGLKIEPILGPSGSQEFWRVAPIVVNNGNTPTRNLRWTARAGDWDMDFTAPGRVHRPGEKGPAIPALESFRGQLRDGTFNPATLAPKQETNTLMQESIPVRYTEAIRSQKMRVYIHGTLVYEDFLSPRVHITRYCYMLWGFPPVTGPVGFSHSGCGGRSNCADEECEGYEELPGMLKR